MAGRPYRLEFIGCGLVRTLKTLPNAMKRASLMVPAYQLPRGTRWEVSKFEQGKRVVVGEGTVL